MKWYIIWQFVFYSIWVISGQWKDHYQAPCNKGSWRNLASCKYHVVPSWKFFWFVVYIPVNKVGSLFDLWFTSQSTKLEVWFVVLCPSQQSWKFDLWFYVPVNKVGSLICGSTYHSTKLEVWFVVLIPSQQSWKFDLWFYVPVNKVGSLFDFWFYVPVNKVGSLFDLWF